MRKTATLTVLAALNLTLGYAQQWYLLIRIGPGAETDALFAAMAIPWMVLATVSESLANVLLPMLATRSAVERRQAVWQFMYFTGFAFGLLSLLLAATAGLWVPLVFPGFAPGQSAMCIALTRTLLAGMFLNALATVLISSAGAGGQFVRAEGVTLAANLLATVVVVGLAGPLGVASYAWCLIAKFGLILALLRGELGRFRRVDARFADLRSAARRLVPLMLGASYYKTDMVVDRYLTSLSPPGALSLLYLAQQIYGAGNQVLTRAAIAPLMPRLAVAAGHGDWKGVTALWWRAMLATGLVAAVIYVGIALAGEPALDLVLGYRQFTADKLHLFWMLLLALGGVWIGGMLGSVVVNSFYAVGDTRTPTWVGVVSYTVYLPVKIFVFFRYGLLAMAICASAYYLINLMVMAALFRVQANQRSR